MIKKGERRKREGDNDVRRIEKGKTENEKEEM